MKNVCILGSTGSIGKSALEVIHHLKDKFNVFAISCHKNVSLLTQQIERFAPQYACIVEGEVNVKSIRKTTILRGIEGICKIVSHPEVDIVLNGMTGTKSVYPVIEAIRNKKRIAMANKEVLVAYGEIIMKKVRESGALLLPVDSEHSAIHQCIAQSSASVRRIILTASGGAFLNTPITQELTRVDALRHPVWKMGDKITIDSATLMNKGLEVIEASILFGIPPQNIQVIIHPQSIVHSAVEFVDGSILAQLSLPDMKLPIQYSLTYPERYPSLIKPLELDKIKKLEFMSPDFGKFPCLRLAYEAAYTGGTMPCVLNAANEVAVNAFLQEKIKLTQISDIVRKVMARHKTITSPSLKEIEETEQWGIKEAKKEVKIMS